MQMMSFLRYNQLMLRSKASSNYRNVIDRYGQSILHDIVMTSFNVPYEECKKLIKHCLKKGYDINLQDEMGRTPTHLAVRQGCLDVVHILLTNGADINITDKEGISAFERACLNLEDDYTCSEIQLYKYLACHINKMISAGCWISEKIKNIYRTSLNTYSYHCHVDFEQECEELHKMSNIVLYKQITLRSFLKKRVNEMTVLIDNEVLEKIVTNVNQEFPFFGCLVKSQYNNGLTFKRLSNIAHVAFETLLGYPVPVLCFKKIGLYLESKDLKNIIKSAEYH